MRRLSLKRPNKSKKSPTWRIVAVVTVKSEVEIISAKVKAMATKEKEVITLRRKRTKGLTKIKGISKKISNTSKKVNTMTLKANHCLSRKLLNKPKVFQTP